MMSSNSSSHKESPLSSSTTPPTQTHCWAPQSVPLPTSPQTYILLFFQTHALSSCLSHLRPGPQKRPPLLAPMCLLPNSFPRVCVANTSFLYIHFIYTFLKNVNHSLYSIPFSPVSDVQQSGQETMPSASDPHRPQHPPGLIPRYPDITDYIRHAAIHTHRFHISLYEDLLKLPCVLSHPPSKAFDVSPLPT